MGRKTHNKSAMGAFVFPDPSTCFEMMDGQYACDWFLFPSPKILTCASRSMKKNPKNWALVLIDSLDNPTVNSYQFKKFSYLRLSGFIPNEVKAIVLVERRLAMKAVSYCESHGIRILSDIGNESNGMYKVDVPIEAALYRCGIPFEVSFNNRGHNDVDIYHRIGVKDGYLPYDDRTYTDVKARDIVSFLIGTLFRLPYEWIAGTNVLKLIDALTSGGLSEDITYDIGKDLTHCELPSGQEKFILPDAVDPLCINEGLWSAGISEITHDPFMNYTLRVYHPDIVPYGCDANRWCEIWRSILPQIVSLIVLWLDLTPYELRENNLYRSIMSLIDDSSDDFLVDPSILSFNRNVYRAIAADVPIDELKPALSETERTFREDVKRRLLRIQTVSAMSSEYSQIIS